jgi:hypothetical protein
VTIQFKDEKGGGQTIPIKNDVVEIILELKGKRFWFLYYSDGDRWEVTKWLIYDSL